MFPPHSPCVPAEEFAGKSGATDLVEQVQEYGDWLFQGDAMPGKILEGLERNKPADNTLIIVTSDNGAGKRACAPIRESDPLSPRSRTRP